jgi:hypothetical protein
VIGTALGRFRNTPPVLADGQIAKELQLGPHGELKTLGYSSSGAVITNGTISTDGQSNPVAPFVAACPYLYRGDGTWDRLRTPVVHKVVVGVTITTETTIWTPAAGKKFRLMAILFTLSSATRLTLRDNTAGTQFVVVAPNAGLPTVLVYPGNGYLSSSINNVLTAQSAAIANLDAVLIGTEE